MNSIEFIKAVDLVAKEKCISKDIIFEAMELALASAYKKNFDSKTNVRVDVNRDTGDIKVFSVLNVVEEISEEDEEAYAKILVEDARKIVKGINAGETIETEVTPKDFGIKVRDYCDELQITANNKMRTAYELLMMESYYGNICDTPYLSVKAEHNKDNWEQVKSLAERLFKDGYKFAFANIEKYKDKDVHSDIDKSRYFADVPKELIVDFLSNIKSSLVNMKFNRQNLIDFINDEETEGVDKWDIVFEGGDGQSFYDIPGLEMIRCPKRQVEEHDHVIQISSRRRILGLREGKFCLNKEEIELAEKRCRAVWEKDDANVQGRSIPLKAYFEHLPCRKPVLIIMLIEPIEPENREANKKAIEYIENLNGNKMIAFAIGFPGVKETGKTKKYKVNKTYYQLNMLDDPDEVEDDEE